MNKCLDLIDQQRLNLANPVSRHRDSVVSVVFLFTNIMIQKLGERLDCPRNRIFDILFIAVFRQHAYQILVNLCPQS